MELREIAAFIQVAQLKSFSKAAKQLGYSQAAVTIQIKQLEQELRYRGDICPYLLPEFH